MTFYISQSLPPSPNPPVLISQELMANARQYGEADKLALYGLFKQAKWGDCPAGLVTAQRGNPVGSVKVRAWVTNRGKPTAQAMQEFIVVLGRVSERCMHANTAVPCRQVA